MKQQRGCRIEEAPRRSARSLPRDGNHCGGVVPDQPEWKENSSAEPGQSRLDRIARRARELYEARGGAHGRDLDDWLQAEREIDAEDEKTHQNE
jgi:hypothetical protein